jgi:tetratricopeptide (TPR) repeat protein
MRSRTPLAISFLAWSALLVVACGAPPVEERLADIQQMMSESRFEDAIAELREILDTDPEHARANFMLAMAFQRTNQATLSVWPLEKAFNDPEFQVRAGLQLGNLHLALANPTDAARVATRLIEIAPENTEAHRIRARAYLADKRFDDALVDAEWLIETEPSQPLGLVLKGSIFSDMERFDEAEQAFRKAIELTAEEPPDNERAWIVLTSFLSKNTDDAERAEAAFAEAREAHPDSPALRGAYLTFLAGNERFEDAERVLREAIEREPENIQLRVALSSNLRSQDRIDDANAVLEAMTEDFPIAASWQVLGRTRLDAEDFAGAREALERAVELAPADEELRFLLAEAQVRDGDNDAARDLAKGFERQPYQQFVEGLIAMESEEFAAALEAFESGLRNWPDNAGARHNAGMAAQMLGDWDRAVNEFTEAARIEMSAARISADPFQTEAALQLARIYQRRANYSSAVYWARTYLRYNQDDHDTMALLDTPVAQEARIDLASLEFEAGDAAKGWKLLAEAEPGDLRALSVAADRNMADGNLGAALARIDEAQASGEYAEVDLLALRGRVLHTGGKPEQAEAAFRKAIELDPDHPATLAALATIQANDGQLEEAIATFERAAELEPQNASHSYHAGQLLLQLGRTEQAEAKLRDAARVDPGHAEARNDLAWLLSNEPAQLAEAYRIGSEAYRLNNASAFADTLGWIHYLRGEYPLAVDLLSRAAQDEPADPVIRYHLGMALSRQGQNERALEELKAAVGTAGFPEAESAELEIARLEGVGS